MTIVVLVVSVLLAAFGRFTLWASQYEDTKYSPLGPTRTVGIAALVIAGLLIASLVIRRRLRGHLKAS